MWSNDITFCSNEDCCHNDCRRHHTRTPKGVPYSNARFGNADGTCYEYLPDDDREDWRSLYHTQNVEINLRKDDELYQRLAAYAERKGKSVEVVIDTLVSLGSYKLLSDALDRRE